MAATGVRNPNICADCERLLEDDCAELMAALSGSTKVPVAKRTVESTMLAEEQADQPHTSVPA